MAQKHIVILQGNCSKNIEIFYSSWPREIGDTVKGMKVVGLLLTEQEKYEFIRQWNEKVRAHNAIVRRQNRQAQRTAWANMFSSNTRLAELLNNYAEAVAMERSAK